MPDVIHGKYDIYACAPVQIARPAGSDLWKCNPIATSIADFFVFLRSRGLFYSRDSVRAGDFRGVVVYNLRHDEQAWSCRPWGGHSAPIT